ncbi:MAG: hypothetical protein GXO83_12660 [Chlorobi bacterium]|nr:hypothetical protein [Chlorobiota bacterium]
MRKRNWIFIIISGLIVIGGVFAILRWSGRWLSPPAEPFHVVPQDALFVVEINDFPGFIEQVTGKNRLWNDLQKINGIKKAGLVLQRLDTIFNNEQIFRQIFRKNPCVFSIHASGKNKLAVLAVVRIPGFIKGSSVKNAFSGYRFSTSGNAVRNYMGHKIFSVTDSMRTTAFYYTMSQGLLIMSTSRIVLESSLRQMSAPSSILDQEGFMKIKGTAGYNTTGNFFIRSDVLPEWLRQRLKRSVITQWTSLFPVAGWSEMDINLQEESLLMNGFSYPDPNDRQLLNLFMDTDPGNIDFYQIFPSTAFAGAILYVKDWKRYREKLRIYRGKQRSSYYTGLLETYRVQCGKDPEEALIPVLTNQAGIAFLNISNQDPGRNRLAVLGVKSQSMARAAMEKLLKGYASKKGIRYSGLIHTISLDRETKFTIYRFPFPQMIESLFGDIFGKGPYPYFTFFENHLIFGGSEAVLSRFLQDNLLHRTLANDPDFKTFTDGLSSRSNFFFYIHLPSAEKLVSRYFNNAFMKGFHDYAGKQIKINYLGYQAISQNHLVYNNFYALFRNEIKKAASTVWESLLDTTIHYKPQLFINHYTREKEIFVQDLKNQIYLINNAGRILWKVSIPERILGQAYQIDYYKNGKLQILFNTRHYLYLVDRNGNNVEHYPVLLRSPATNGASVFDYDKNRDYRIFVGGDDKKMYLYNKEGGLVQGWNMKTYESRIYTPVKHFRIHKKDYIVFSDTMNVYVLNRRGNTRVKVREHIPKTGHQNILLDDFTNAAPRMIINGTHGRVFQVSFNGEVTSIIFEGIGDHSWFDFTDLDGDRKGEYIFLHDKNLDVFQNTEKKIFSRNFDSEITDPPVVFVFSVRDKKIGIVDATIHTIYLVNNNGTLYGGFPLKGSSLFTIGKFEPAETRFNLIVGGEDNFLYNYIVK